MAAGNPTSTHHGRSRAHMQQNAQKTVFSFRTEEHSLEHSSQHILAEAEEANRARERANKEKKKVKLDGGDIFRIDMLLICLDFKTTETCQARLCVFESSFEERGGNLGTSFFGWEYV